MVDSVVSSCVAQLSETGSGHRVMELLGQRYLGQVGSDVKTLVPTAVQRDYLIVSSIISCSHVTNA